MEQQFVVVVTDSDRDVIYARPIAGSQDDMPGIARAARDAWEKMFPIAEWVRVWDGDDLIAEYHRSGFCPTP